MNGRRGLGRVSSELQPAWRRRSLALLGGLVVAAASALLAAPIGAPSVAAPISECTDSAGTIIAVDYSHWGGSVVRGCDTSNPSSGYNLLYNQGFRMAGTSHDGPAFICRIGNQAFNGGTQYPTPATEACVLTPPASAYWSYWLAPAGQNSWSYSQFGAMSEVPKPGEVELWIFGGTHIQGANGDPVDGFPTCSPASLRAGGSGAHCSPSGSSGNAAPAPTAAAPPPATNAGGGGGSGSNGGSGNGGGSRPTAGSGRSGSSAAGSGATPSSSTSAGTTPSASSSDASGTSSSPGASTSGASDGHSSNGAGATAIDAQPAAKTTSGTGPVIPLVIGLSLVVVLGGGAGAMMWRRRRQQE